MVKKKTIKFWKDTGFRCLYTMAETALAMLVPYTLITEVDFLTVVYTVILAGVVTALKSIVIDLKKYKVE